MSGKIEGVDDKDCLVHYLLVEREVPGPVLFAMGIVAGLKLAEDGCLQPLCKRCLAMLEKCAEANGIALNVLPSKQAWEDLRRASNGPHGVNERSRDEN